jgi:predicted MarR family transcription regulator
VKDNIVHMATKTIPASVEYLSRNHTALLILKSLRRPALPKDILNVSPNFFKDTKTVFGCLRVLKNHGFVERTEKGWKVTQEGSNFLRRIARKYTGG